MNLKKTSLAVLLGLAISQPAFSDVSGSVFRDLPVNGTYGVKGANEIGVAGITVTVTDDLGVQIGTANTDASGAWTVVSNAANVRVEFTGIPSFLPPSPLNLAGANTSVQFISDGGTASLGLHNPSRHSQPDPDVVMPFHVNGDAIGGGSAGATAGIIFHAYTATGEDGTSAGNPPTNAVTQTSETGAVYGLAYQKETNSLFSSAYLKRHVGLKNALGSIFITTDVGGAPQTTEYVNLADFSIDTGVLPVRDLNADSSVPSHDVGAYSQVGKIGLGDIDFSPDGSALFAVNLNSKTLVSLAIGNPAKAAGSVLAGDVSEIAIPTPTCTSGEWRPFALGAGEEKLYVGGLCDGSVGALANVHAYIYEYDIATSAFNATPVVNFTLDFPRGFVHIGQGVCQNWSPWSDNFADATNFEGHRYCLPQPIFTDIEVDIDGSLILGFRDRFGDQLGARNYKPDVSDTSTVNAQANGDTYRVYNNNGTFVLESNGVAGSVSGAANNNDGPDGGEFYSGDVFENHSNTGLGGLATLYGSNEVVGSFMDPKATFSGGTRWLSNQDGSSQQVYQVYRSESNGIASFSKANGLGDVEFLSEPAPLEIGNRVWDDTNGNGVQDAGELGIDGVTITLDCAGAISTQDTANGGLYRFANVPPNTQCTITVPVDVNGNGLTTQTATANETLGSNADDTGSFTFTTGASGENNHSYDIGYRAAPACVINSPTVTTQCNDAGSPSDPSDDTFTYTINATGTGVGATYDVSSGDNQTGLSYGADHVSTASFPIANGDLSLVLTDVDTVSCTLVNIAATAPATCSNVVVAPEVDLELVKTVSSASVLSGDTVTYTITVKNNGPDDATGVQVSDQLPAGVTATGNNVASVGTYNAGTGTWAVGALANQSTETLTIEVTID